MKRLLDYSRFVSCCRRYRTAKAMLNEESFDPVSLIDMDIKRRLEQETRAVEEIFRRIDEKNPKLSRIMFLKLVDRKPLRTIGLSSEVNMSKRQIVMKYPEKDWEALYNDLLS